MGNNSFRVRVLEQEVSDEYQILLVFEPPIRPLLSRPAAGFHLILVAHRLVTWVLSLSLSPPSSPTSLLKNSPLKPRELKAISWGLTTLSFRPKESPASYFPGRVSSQGNSAASFGFVFFSLHINGETEPRIESKLSRTFQVREQSRRKNMELLTGRLRAV